MDQSRLGPFVRRARRAGLLLPLLMTVAAVGCGRHHRSSMRPVYMSPAPIAAPGGCPTDSTVLPEEPALTPEPMPTTEPTTGRTRLEPGFEPALVPAEAPLSSTPAGPSMPRLDTPPPVTAPSVPSGASDEPGLEPVPSANERSSTKPGAGKAGDGSVKPAAPGASFRSDPAGRPVRGRATPAPTAGRVRSASLASQLRPHVDDPSDLFAPPKADRPWKYIVLHHSATAAGGYASIDAEHRKRLGWNGCGYHFVIGNGTETPDGRIEVARRWADQKLGVHCRDGKDPDVNEYGIGICLVGDLEASPPTARQVEAARALIAYLESRYAIPADHTQTHARLAASPTSCPGRHFPERTVLGDRPGLTARQGSTVDSIE